MIGEQLYHRRSAVPASARHVRRLSLQVACTRRNVARLRPVIIYHNGGELVSPGNSETMLKTWVTGERRVNACKRTGTTARREGLGEKNARESDYAEYYGHGRANDAARRSTPDGSRLLTDAAERCQVSRAAAGRDHLAGCRALEKRGGGAVVGTVDRGYTGGMVGERTPVLRGCHWSRQGRNARQAPVGFYRRARDAGARHGQIFRGTPESRLRF